MTDKKDLKEMIRIEWEYFKTLEVGSPEYTQSQERLMKLTKQLTEQKGSTWEAGIEIVRVIGQIGLPVVGLVVITAFEKNDTFTSSLKRFVDCFLPKRL